ncbi:TonB-dependent siderophore receptor [Parafrankia sp. BMG5.11]|uniref:TonB-dependent receptor plug domain-containing protein n=1 Tax=Parafrankia sp. BMG5.11 TaxID=222540 RepID=UPI00103B7D06|nr:TonB-dependent receptor [Parafrankia sp. BMG5.11]TCJ40870.1 TonB-dependent receptor [Parafrankia sp. BMG5.11]
MKPVVYLASALAASFAANPAAAQSDPAAPAPPVEGPGIVVTGAGLPDTPATPAYGTVVLDRETLVSTGSGRIEDALSSVAGFQQFRRSDSRSANPSAQGVTLRALGGNASSRAQVLLDGVPMADPFFGYIPFSAIAPERLSSARVTRGGGSGPFGAGALAGTIELTSADAATLGLMSGQASVNDRGETETSATVAPRLGAGFVALSGRWDRGQGFWTTPRDQRVPASVRAAFDAWSIQARTVAPLSDSIELQARVLLYEDDRTLRFAGADTSMEGQDASLRLVGRGAWQFDLLGYVQARNFTNVVVSSTAFVPTLDQRNTPATGIGGKFELRPPTGENHVLRLGVDYRRSSGELFEHAISTATGAVTQWRNAGGVTADLGLFAENDLTIGPVTLTAGARADHYAITRGFFTARAAGGAVVTDTVFPDRSGWETSFRGGALARLGGGVRLRAAAYTGLRLPTLNELYRPFTVFPVVTQANANLRNERLIGYEAGIDYAPAPAVDLSLTAFDNRVKHAVANVTLGPNLRQRQNIDAIRARGIEASARAAVGRFDVTGSLAWTKAESRGSGQAAALDRLRPAQTPRWTASATVAWRPSADARVALSLRHVGDQFEDDLETNVLPAATTLDLFAQVPLSPRFSVVVRGENLTDRPVITRNQAGSIDLGAPRTLWAGVALDL